MFVLHLLNKRPHHSLCCMLLNNSFSHPGRSLSFLLLPSIAFFPSLLFSFFNIIILLASPPSILLLLLLSFLLMFLLLTPSTADSPFPFLHLSLYIINYMNFTYCTVETPYHDTALMLTANDDGHLDYFRIVRVHQTLLVD